MEKLIKIESKPEEQLRDNKIIEISFYDSKGDCRGFFMSLRFFEDRPVVRVYQIDEGVNIYLAIERK